MNSHRHNSTTTTDGFSPLLPFSNFPPPTSTPKRLPPPPAARKVPERDDAEQFAVYGIKLWRWKISIQFPRRYSKVAKSEDEFEEMKKRSSSSSLRANEDFFRQIEFPTGILKPLSLDTTCSGYRTTESNSLWAHRHCLPTEISTELLDSMAVGSTYFL